MPSHHLTDRGEKEKIEDEICLFAQTNFRNQMRRFGIKTDDRRRHMYVIGKTGMGKTTVMENMVLSDIYNGHGVGIVDPHGDFAEKIIDFIPPNRINDIVYINPADTGFPVGFNILEYESEEQKGLIVGGLMATFKKIWPDVWSSRMEYILNNTLLALLDYPGSTLLGINRILGEKAFRKKVVRKLKDPVIKSFWQNEFENYEPRYQKEAVAPIQNKIGQFLSSSVIRNMVAQVKSTINIRQLMDDKKIIIMNLSKGRIGEDNSRLLGGMLVTKIQLSAMERVDTPEEERKDFFLYVDEFQNFATPAFANILSEARKYRLSIIMAHQYVAQLDEVVADAVFGNVGSIITFRVGGSDAEALTKEFTPTFMEEDIVNLSKFTIILKLMIDGVASQPFTANTMPPIGSPTGSREKVIKVSRERYGRSRASVEDKIMRWSGMGGDEEDLEMDVDTTREKKDKPKENKPKKREEKPKQEKKTESSSEKPKEDKTVSFKNAMSEEDRLKLQQVVQNVDVEEEPKKVEKNVYAATEEEILESKVEAEQDTPVREEKPEVLEIHFDPKYDKKEEKNEVKTVTEETSKKKEERAPKNETTPIDPTEEKSKRKRKRKRRRKKKTDGEGDNKKPDVPIDSMQTESKPDSTPTSNTANTKIQPDQIITFD